MAKSSKRSTKLGRKKRKSKRAKHSSTQSETAIQVVNAEIVNGEERAARFYVPVEKRVSAIALHLMNIPAIKIADELELSPVTVKKIITTAPEVEAITNAMQTAGKIELMKAIPVAVKSLTDQIKEGDGGLALAMLRGLQLLNPRAEIVANAKGGEFDDWTVAELTKFLADGNKPEGK